MTGEIGRLMELEHSRDTNTKESYMFFFHYRSEQYW